MLVLEAGFEVRGLAFNLVASLGPEVEQLGGHAGEVGGVALVDVFPGQAQPGGQLGSQYGAGEDAAGFRVEKDGAAVKGAPGAVVAQHPVRDQQVGVQLRVTGAAVGVDEPSDGRPGADRGRLDAVGAAPRHHRVTGHVVHSGVDRSEERLLDLAAHLGCRQCPQRRHALGHRDRPIERGEVLAPPGDASRVGLAAADRVPATEPVACNRVVAGQVDAQLIRSDLGALDHAHAA